MKISVITVSYDSEKVIANCINSVLSQSYKNLEYIIIDGNSIDGTLQIIQNIHDKRVCFVSEPDLGIYDAMNKGINLASGDVIGILNSDDIYQDQHVLEDVVSCFNANPGLDILYGNLVYVKNNDIGKVVRKWNSLPYYFNFFEDGNVPPHPALFVKKNVYKIAGIFNLKYQLAADYEFMLRIFKKHHFSSFYLNRLMIRMRLGGATNKNYRNILNGNKEIINSWKENGLKAPIALMPLRIIKRLMQFI